MKQCYFVHNGKSYYCGTAIIIKTQDHISGKMINTTATFMCFNTDKNCMVFKVKNCVNTCPKGYFDRIFVGIGDYVVGKEEYYHKIDISKMDANQKHKFSDELRIDGMMLAWTWYIVIMLAAVIFYARIGIWSLSSIIFICYRNKKLKEAGFKL